MENTETLSCSEDSVHFLVAILSLDSINNLWLLTSNLIFPVSTACMGLFACMMCISWKNLSYPITSIKNMTTHIHYFLPSIIFFSEFSNLFQVENDLSPQHWKLFFCKLSFLRVTFRFQLKLFVVFSCSRQVSFLLTDCRFSLWQVVSNFLAADFCLFTEQIVVFSLTRLSCLLDCRRFLRHICVFARLSSLICFA